MNKRLLLLVLSLSLFVTVSIPTFASTTDTTAKGGLTVEHKTFDTGTSNYNTVNNTVTTVTTSATSSNSSDSSNSSADTWSQDQWGGWILRDGNGKLKEDGWVQCGSSWYFTSIGHMVKNCYWDGYYLGADGACTDSPTWDITSNGKVISPESVKATSDMYKKLLNEGWIKYSAHWYDNFAYVIPAYRADGAHYFTRCYINSGVATIKFLTNCQSYGAFQAAHEPYVDLPLEQYLKYKSEGKIGIFTYNITSFSTGNITVIIQEYIKK